MLKDTNQIPTKPKWLRVLEQQSWQAELVISGIAIFGSLQIPAILFNTIDFVLVSFSDSSLLYFEYFFIYLLIGIRILIAGFIIHFVLRALWVGMLGLVSVFPQGIGDSTSIYSSHFLEKLKKEFPDINAFNQKLDNLCSLLLSISALAVLIFLTIAGWVLMVIILHNVLSTFLSKDTVILIMEILGALVVLLFFFLALLNTKKFRETTIAKRFQYPLSRGFNKGFTHIFYEPYLYIFLTLITNLKLKANQKIMFFAGFFTLVMFFSIDLGFSNIRYFDSDNYFRLNSKDYTSSALNYEDQFRGNRIVRPVIPSEIIRDDHLRLFLPWYDREDSFRTVLCGEPSLGEAMEKDEKWRIEGLFNNDCMTKYYTIFIDDKVIPGVIFRKHYHENNEEEGSLTYIALDSLKNGPHLLKIERGYTNDKGEKAIQFIPFLLERKE
ncbi:MAG: hypothetical protein KDC85_14605 [Saprospiraceae bacterium]|nr:hypothetical protein [Saprospiraceae bacterium]MCB9325149.1 hypothetical protein [Lewinellaceae bacterium]